MIKLGESINVFARGVREHGKYSENFIKGTQRYSYDVLI